MQDQALTRGVPDDQVPFLPADLVPVEREARAVRLGDIDRLDVRPQRGDHWVVPSVGRELGCIVARQRRQRYHVVVHGEHGRGVQVHGNDQVFRRPGERVVGWREADPGQRLGHPGVVSGVAFLVVTRGPRLHLNMGVVGDPPAPHRLLPAGIGLHRLHRGQEVPPAGLGPRARHRQPGPDLAISQRDHHLAYQAPGPVVQHHLALPVWHPAGQLILGHGGLGRLAKRDVDEHRAVGVLRVRAHGRRCVTNLIFGQRLQRVPQPVRLLASRLHYRASLEESLAWLLRTRLWCSSTRFSYAAPCRGPS